MKQNWNLHRKGWGVQTCLLIISNLLIVITFYKKRYCIVVLSKCIASHANIFPFIFLLSCRYVQLWFTISRYNIIFTSTRICYYLFIISEPSDIRCWPPSCRTLKWRAVISIDGNWTGGPFRACCGFFWKLHKNLLLTCLYSSSSNR